ncbi:DUF7563 family protein [Halobellus captivus]
MMRLSYEAQPRYCDNCGAQVINDFRRVYGDGGGVAHRCLECDTAVRIQQGSAAGRDVRTPSLDERHRECDERAATTTRVRIQTDRRNRLRTV